MDRQSSEQEMLALADRKIDSLSPAQLSAIAAQLESQRYKFAGTETYDLYAKVMGRVNRALL
jgi:hypothetical protein